PTRRSSDLVCASASYLALPAKAPPRAVCISNHPSDCAWAEPSVNNPATISIIHFMATCKKDLLDSAKILGPAAARHRGRRGCPAEHSSSLGPLMRID